MNNCGTIMDQDVTENTYEATQEPVMSRMLEDQHNKIIKQMYAKVDVDEYDKTLHHLSNNEWVKLAHVLSPYSDMCKGMIGTLNILPMHFKLKPAAKPFHVRPFPIPKVYENFTKEVCGRFEKDTVWHHTLDSE